MKRKQSEKNQPDKNNAETLDLLKPLEDFSSTEKQASEMLNSQLCWNVNEPIFINSEFISAQIHEQYELKGQSKSNVDSKGHESAHSLVEEQSSKQVLELTTIVEGLKRDNLILLELFHTTRAKYFLLETKIDGIKRIIQ